MLILYYILSLVFVLLNKNNNIRIFKLCCYADMIIIEFDKIVFKV